jgi:hypothetical protein
MEKLHKYTLVTAIFFNSVLLVGALWFFWDVDASAQEKKAGITLFEDYSGEIVNGSKHVGFTYNLTEPGVDKLLFEGGKILFSNGTILLS